MSATSRARRSDSLYHETDSGITRRWLCDKVALLEDELHEAQEELYGLHCMIAKSEAENAKLREYATKLEQANIVLSSDNTDLLNDMRDMQFFIDENRKLRELATYALKHIVEVWCEGEGRDLYRGKPCEDCVDAGSSDCPKCMPRMFDVSGIEVDE